MWTYNGFCHTQIHKIKQQKNTMLFMMFQVINVKQVKQHVLS